MSCDLHPTELLGSTWQDSTAWQDGTALIPQSLIHPGWDPRWSDHEGQSTAQGVTAQGATAQGATAQGFLDRFDAAVWDRACATLEWEYKVVRSPRRALRNPAIFHRLCREEAQAGWMLLETLDDRRLRFKRPTLARLLIDPNQLTFDPYRTTYPAPVNGRRILSVLALIVAAILPAYVGYTWVSLQLQGPWREDLPLPVVNTWPATTSLAPPTPYPTP
jgi:hypothetical protein